MGSVALHREASIIRGQKGQCTAALLAVISTSAIVTQGREAKSYPVDLAP